MLKKVKEGIKEIKIKTIEYDSGWHTKSKPLIPSDKTLEEFLKENNILEEKLSTKINEMPTNNLKS